MTLKRTHWWIWGLLSVWLGITLVLLLVPAPREWGRLGDHLSPLYDQLMPVLQPLAHIVLMAGLAWIIHLFFSGFGKHRKLVFSGLLAMLIATGLEFLQLALPSSFGRSCDPADLTFAMAGVLLGLGVAAFCPAWKGHRTSGETGSKPADKR